MAVTKKSLEEYEKNGFLDRESWEFPRIINVNVWRGACPCSCVHCPVGMTPIEERKLRFGQGGINPGLFEKIVDEIAERNSQGLLRIHSVGEPLLWDSLVPAIRYAHSRNVKTWIFTSALTKDMDLLEELCKNIDIIEVSVNSTTRKDYKRTKGTDGFDTVCGSITHMSTFIMENGLPTRLLVSRVQSQDKSLDEAFPQFWLQKPGIADAFVRSYHNYNGIIGEKKEEHVIRPCLVHWARFNIDSDGTAVVCFNELFREKVNQDVILGDVNSQTIESIWKSDKMNRIRRYMLGTGVSGESYEGSLPCESCSFCQPYPPHEFTSERQLKTLKRNDQA